MGFASKSRHFYSGQKSMKIVHVIDYFQPRLGYQETFLAKEHPKLGHEVYVVTSDRYNPIIFEGDAARQVEKLLDPDIRKRMGNNGRKAIEERLNWTAIAKQFLELVE